MHVKLVTQRELLGVPLRGIALTHPSNPVVFLDIACPRSAAGGEENGMPKRILLELFADLAPTLASNMYGLCVGSSTRIVDQKLQPAGYKGTVLHDTLVGQYLIGGDVMGGGGSGFFSALGERQGPLPVPPNELEALTATAPSRCKTSQGLYMLYWNHTPGTASAMALKVASSFRLDTVERGADATMPNDAILIGRMVHRDAEAHAAAKGQLLEMTKAVFHAKREMVPRLLPTIVLCGEM
ncbi:peptidyl-prolyl isomerase E (cyclophilin E) [Trypanosoma rangeli]|uniref:Peptidyl-prolyl isomerase E (Cyclophilin E) n=1 Tax=Trypanosoma rangeli TaxID=5698 RepID=A0A422NWX3_TRYRA|nr:peptidyl-prolyl isomerase E (cyclophilin E) [Trypanosoma rangeli]RNF09915.1 peptidyl-prolyl isomerase E (cyclophilin E) [Trypanosoma rangeli]|eukprot:RNF09915.1 peptidyl-prolyl isomerase E (cyclophilin E) [Trypanosoma rangeli]